MRWTPSGVVVVILAACVGGGWTTALVVSVLHHDHTPVEITALLDTLGGILAGAIVGWLTSEWTHRRRDVDDVDEPGHDETRRQG